LPSAAKERSLMNLLLILRILEELHFYCKLTLSALKVYVLSLILGVVVVVAELVVAAAELT
jgi:hypothetical protein